MERVVPLTIGPANALAVTGSPWRWVRARAVELGVPILGTKRKGVISAAGFIAALEREASGGTARSGNAADPAATLRERLGLRLVGGAR